MRVQKIKDPKLVEKLYQSGMSVSDVAKEFGVAHGSMQGFMKKHGIKPRSRSEAKRVSNKTMVGLNNWRKENKPWCEGLTKNDPKIKKMIDKGRKTQIKNGKSKGKNNPMYGKIVSWNHGYRKDLGFSVRSSWEADFSRLLIKLGIKFEYEKYTFQLQGNQTYTPDFYIPSKNLFYEIKGYEKNDKHIRFQKEYPDKKLRIIREHQYKKIMNYFSKKGLVLEDNGTKLSRSDVKKMFIYFCKEDAGLVSVGRFCKSIGISQKTVVKHFGKESLLVDECRVELDEIDKIKLKNKYEEYYLHNNKYPTKEELKEFYSMAKRILYNKFNGSIKQFKREML